jgi:arsenate reductase
MGKILFVCIHNSARSQMAEALFSRMCSGQFEAESAGIEPGTLNPLAVAVLKEIGIDISAKKTRGVSQVIRLGTRFDYVSPAAMKAAPGNVRYFPAHQPGFTGVYRPLKISRQLAGKVGANSRCQECD